MKKKYSVNGSDKSNIFVISNGIAATTTNNSNEDVEVEKPADFETAIRATGFGMFNFHLICCLLPSITSTMLATTALSYVIPIAQCDLNLTLQNKGMLNAITYLGMISSAFIWGYLADTIGRRKLLIVGFLLDGFLVLLSGFSQHFTMLIVSKFVAGFIINGPFAVSICYINEFHSAKYRSLIPLLTGIFNCVCSTLLPLLGWRIFTDTIFISLLDGLVVLHSWNLFLFITALPSIVAGLSYLTLPESPKFLMSMGENQKAYELFQKVYSINTGKPPETYPIKCLLDETKLHEDDSLIHGGHVTAHRTNLQALKEGWQQITPLFFPPYLSKMLMVFCIQFAAMLHMNTIRLWLPQLFSAINDYQTIYKNEHDASLCQMLEVLDSKHVNSNGTCFVNYENSAVYRNSIIVSLVSMGIYIFAALIIYKLGKRLVLGGAATVAGICAGCLYFSNSEAMVVTLFALHSGFTGLSISVIISVAVDIFPTTLRTMTVSLTMMCGRCGAMIGNLIFPFLLASGCLPPFLTIAAFAIGGALLSLLLPKTDTKPLE